MKKQKLWLKIPLAVVGFFLLVIIGYVVYVLLAYHRLEDRLTLDVDNRASGSAAVGETYTLSTWNIGFGAYSEDYSFFMDGGQYGTARSKEEVLKNTAGVVDTLSALDPDFLFFQEVDLDSTRSFHVDQYATLMEEFPGDSSDFAVNFDSAFLFYPFSQPHGKSLAGIATFSSFAIDGAIRRSLPVDEGLTKYIDLDRCYSVSRVPVDNGRTLCLYNLHLSAYTADGTISTDQLYLLLADMEAEYASGSYVIAGGDFNKDLSGRANEIFGNKDVYNWSLPFPAEALPDGFALAAPYDPEQPVPTCRNADAPYEDGKTFVTIVDGFIVSDNVQVVSTKTVDMGFVYSDHNPVVLTFILE